MTMLNVDLFLLININKSIIPYLYTYTYTYPYPYAYIYICISQYSILLDIVFYFYIMVPNMAPAAWHGAAVPRSQPRQRPVFRRSE